MIYKIGHLSLKAQRMLLLLLCAVLFALWLQHVPLTEIDETRYTEATREMLESGNFLIPQFNYAPRYQKPILYYWIQSVPVALLGSSEQAARLPSAILAGLLVFMLHAFLWRWLPKALAGLARGDEIARIGAFLGAVALATMPMITIWTRGSTTDITLTFFISCALLALLHLELLRAEGETKLSRWYLLAAAAMGLAFLTKGPMGLVLPVLGWLAFQLKSKQLGAEMRRVPWLYAIIIFVVIALPWYVATYFVDGPGFLQHFFGYENVGRFTGNAMEGHGTGNRFLGLLLYLPVALLFLFPYSPFLLHEIVRPFAGAHEVAESVVAKILRRYGWCWLWATIGFFSISKTQLPSYIQSIAPAAAILFALHIVSRLASNPAPGKKALRWVEYAFLLFFGLVYVGGIIWVILQGKAVGPLGGVPFPASIARFALWSTAIIGGTWLLGLAWLGIKDDFPRRIGWVIGGWTLYFTLLILLIAPMAVRSSYAYSVNVGHYAHQFPHETMLISATKTPSEDLVYYSRHKWYFHSFKRPAELEVELRQALTAGKEVVMLLNEKDISKLPAGYKLTKVRSFDHLLLVKVALPETNVEEIK